MKGTSLRIVTLTILLAFALAGISCSKQKAADKEVPRLTPEQAKQHEKMLEERNKSIEASKKNTVAKVNGVAITMYDLISEMNAVAPQFIKPGQKKDEQIDAKVRKAALDRLVFRELAVQEATRQGMKVAPENVSSALKKIKESFKTEDAYRDNLKKSGITEEELKKQLERNMIVDMITEKEIFDKVKVDPKQVKKVYEKDKASYKGPSGQMSFEEARPLIEQKLMTPLVQKREDEWVNSLTKAAKIEITIGESAKEIHSIR